MQRESNPILQAEFKHFSFFPAVFGEMLSFKYGSAARNPFLNLRILNHFSER